MSLTAKLVHGLKSTMLLTLFSQVSQYGILFVLAQSDAALTGYYVKFLLLTATISTFFLLGGNVLAPFFDQDLESPKNYRLCLQYFSIAGLFFALIFACAHYFGTLNSLSGLALSPTLLLLLSSSVFVSNLIMNSENSFLRIQTSVVIFKSPIILIFLLLAAAALLGLDISFSLLDQTYIWVYATVAIFAAWILVLYVRRARAEALDRREIDGSFVKYLVNVQLAKISVYFYENIERYLILLLPAQNSLALLGIYAVAQQTNQLSISLGRQIAFALFPTLSAAAKSENGAKSILRAALRYSCLLVGLIAIMIAGFAETILWAFGSDFADYAVVLVVMAISSAISAVGSVTASQILATKKSGLLLTINLSSMGLYFALGSYLSRSIGVLGITLAQLAAVCIMQFFALYSIWRTQSVFIPQLIALVPLTAAAGFVNLWLHSSMEPFVPIFASIIFILTFGLTKTEVQDIIARLRQSKSR